ncbi:hypothetical protein QFC21_001159 [Naganishia friedmannii]|uniref:Uncharacterized protein n=1 Tax=Naganishia friedmannii TaxID=89922 RepID=A0ACC2W928_9TREE|nr:hypothetical protein QFC21_001159 [Naganishia friedmannii]
MFRKFSENIISAAVSPFSSAPSTPAATAASSTLDIQSLSIASSASSHQARAKVERQLADELAKFGVPMSTEDCAGCDDHQEGCDESEGAGHVTHVQYPRGFDVDWDSDLLASAKPQPRQLVISTGRSDWPHDHTEDETTLSHHLNNALMKAAGITPAPPLKPDQGGKEKDEKALPPAPPPPPPTNPPGMIEITVGKDGLPQGIYEAPATQITPSMQDEPSPTGIPEQPGTMLFSSSLISQSHEGHRETVLAFPDWKVVVDVTNDERGAEGVLTDLVSRTEAQGDSARRTWTLPYRAVVLLSAVSNGSDPRLLGSHKRRDKRCHIAAPLLEKALCQSLEEHHVSVDLQGHSLSADHLEQAFPPLDQIPTDELPIEVEKRLRAIDAVDDAQGNGEVGIFRISHLGGHRYAGVMIICFPSGATLYYGRVSPREIPAVVKETLLGGKILSGLLRSAGNAVRPELVAEHGEEDAGKKIKTVCQRKGKTLLSW